MEKPHILVTGAAGFIGSHLCDHLIALHYRVCGLDNLSLGKIKNISHLLQNKDFTFHEINILHVEDTKNVFRNNHFRAVFHLAANSDIAQSHNDSDIDFVNTFKSTYIVLQMMKEFKVCEIIFASSSAIYGENYENLNEETGPLKPISHYGASKLASEAFLCSFSSNYGIKSWILRFPNIVGPRCTHGVVFDFINKLRKDKTSLEIFGNGEQNKPYLYVQDLIEAMIFTWANSRDGINIFNIGVESRTKVKEIAAFVIRGMNLNPNIVFTGGKTGWIGDVPEFKYDLSKIRKLGWKASLSSNDAVQKAITMIIEGCNR
jgi:UDP-glucose 4-epimerase